MYNKTFNFEMVNRKHIATVLHSTPVATEKTTNQEVAESINMKNDSKKLSVFSYNNMKCVGFARLLKIILCNFVWNRHHKKIKPQLPLLSGTGDELRMSVYVFECAVCVFVLFALFIISFKWMRVNSLWGAVVWFRTICVATFTEVKQQQQKNKKKHSFWLLMLLWLHF